MGVFNHFLFFWEHVASGPLDWCAYLWAATGRLLLNVRHPRRGGLGGQVRGYRRIVRHVLGLGLPQWTDTERSGGRVTVSGGSAKPLVSVIVPVRNEERFLGTCLESILSQTYPAEKTEIIVVENRSTDGTREVALAHAASCNRIRVLTSDAVNQAAAMNDGIEAARGSIIVRVDGHGYLEHDYVSKAVAALERYPEAGAVGGPYLPAGERLIERVVGLARSSPIGVGGGWGSDRGTGDRPARTAGWPAYRREAVMEAGLFDVEMAYGEDDELHWRLNRAGRLVMFCPGLHQYNRTRASLRALARQYWNYGRGRTRVILKHPDFLLPRHVLPSIFVVTVALLGVGALIIPTGRLALAALLGAYAMALGAAVLGAKTRSWLEALLVAPAVAIMHFAYGSGMLWGAGRHLVTRAGRAADRRHGKWRAATEPSRSR
jgi:cellulose synthase/poly-beta-1,6-N-acetylglucosamine synthase-like glycosyltransferase